MKNISPCLWFNDQAQAAADFYTTVFKSVQRGTVARYSEAAAQASGQKPGSVMTLELKIEDLNLLALNGGPHFQFSPAFSFFVSAENPAEIESLWAKLSKGGKVRMGLAKYPWSELYGWTADRFGVDWQLILAKRPQKIVPALLFVDELFGQGQAALDFYTSVFPHSKIETLAREEATKTIQHAAFTLNGQGFVLMEGQGKHGHSFTHATSLIVQCETQAEIDEFWAKLSQGGSPEPCGWLKDRFGLSWQIVPAGLGDIMKDPVRSEKVMRALLQMKKIDLASLKRAAQE